MDEPVPTEGELARTSPRDELLTAIRNTPPSVRPPAVVADAPLSLLPVDLQIRVDARAAAGLSRAGADHPLHWLWPRFVVPAGVVAVAAAFTGLGLAAAGHTVFALIAAGVFAVSTTVASGYALLSSRDPLRLSAAERRAVVAASSWQSAHVWAGELGASPERAAVEVAAHRAAHLAAAGRGGDLRRELDEIDEQAYQAASARLAGDHDQPPDAVVERVARLGGRPGLPGAGTSLSLE